MEIKAGSWAHPAPFAHRAERREQEQPLDQRLEALPFELCRRKRFRLPFTSPFTHISKHEAAERLVDQDDRLFVKIEDRELPLRDTGDVEELEIFHGLRPPRDKLSTLLTQTQVQDASAYEAYNRLTGGWNGAVEPQGCLIADHNLPVGWLTSERVTKDDFYQAVEENRKRAEGAQSRADKLDYLAHFYRNSSDGIPTALEKLGDQELTAAYRSLSQSSYANPAETIRSLEERWPDQLSARARALSALSRPSPELEKAMHDAFDVQLRKGAGPAETGEALYKLTHRRREAEQVLSAVTRHPERIENLTWLMDRGLDLSAADRLLDAVGGRSGHLEVLERLGAFDRDYRQPGYRSGAPEAFHRVLDARLETGAPLEQAEAECKRLWEALVHGDRTDRLQEASQVLAGEVGRRAEVRDTFFDLVENRFHPESAGKFALLLAEPVGSTSQTERRQVFRELGLVGGGAPLSYYDVKEQVYNLYRRDQEIEPLKRLGNLLVKRQSSQEDAEAAFGYYGRSGETLESFCTLLEGGVPVAASVTALEAADNPAAVAVAFAPLGRHATEEAARSVAEALKGHPEEATHLEGLMLAAPRSATRLAEYFKNELVGRPDSALRLSALLRHGLDEERSIKLLEAMEASPDPDGQLQALERLGSFKRDYREPGYYEMAPENFQAALAGCGLPLKEAEAACGRVWKAVAAADRERSLGEALEGLVELRGFERDCYLELLEGNFHAARARGFAAAISDPRELEAFKTIGLVHSSGPLSYYNVKEAAWETYRSQRDVDGLAQLGKALASAEENQATEAFKRYPMGDDERRDFRRMIGAGVAARIARETVDEKGPPEVLVKLSGWRHLDPDTAAAFRRGPADVESLAEVVKRQNVSAEDAVKLAGYVHGSLAGHPEHSAVLTRLVDLGLTADEAIPLLERLEQPLATTSLPERLEALEKLSAFDRNYDAPGYRNRQAPELFYSALSGLVQNGLTLKEASAACSRMWKALASHDRTGGLAAACKYLSGAAEPLRREQFLSFLENQFHAEAAVRLESLLAEPAAGLDYQQRCRDFKELSLVGGGSPLSYYDVKAGMYSAYRSELEAGIPPDQARRRVGRLGQVLEGLRASKETAEEAIEFASNRLRGKEADWSTLAGLLESKLPLPLVTAAIERGGQADLVKALGGLGQLREPTDAAVAAFQAAASVQGVEELASAVGRNNLAEEDCVKAANYLRTRLAEKSEEQAALVQLLDHRLPFDQARALLELISQPLPGTDLEQRLKALEAAGAFSPAYEGPANPTMVYQSLEAQAKSGLSLKHAISNCNKLWRTLYDAGRTKDREAAYKHVGSVGADPARYKQYLSLLANRFHPGPAAGIEELLHQEAGKTDYASRVADFEKMGLIDADAPASYYTVKEGLFKVYRQLLEQGHDRDPAVRTVLRLMERLTALKPEPEATADFLDLYRLDPPAAERALLLQDKQSFADMIELLRQAQALKQGPGFIELGQDRVVIDGMELEVRAE